MPDLEKNKETARRFLATAFDEGNPELAVELYVGETYTQHSPAAEDGKEAFIAHAKRWSEDSDSSEVRHARVFADGDYVILHSEVTAHRHGSDDLSLAVADIYRFDDDGKIVEHWDVVQEIPARSANDNPVV